MSGAFFSLSLSFCCHWIFTTSQGLHAEAVDTRFSESRLGNHTIWKIKVQAGNDRVITEHCLAAFTCRDGALHHIYLVALPSARGARNPLRPLLLKLAVHSRAIDKRTGANARQGQQSAGQTLTRQSQRRSDALDLSWEIMEGPVFVCRARSCEADVCLRWLGPPRCDALHPNWKPLSFPFMRFAPSCTCERQWDEECDQRLLWVCCAKKCKNKKKNGGNNGNLNGKKNPAPVLAAHLKAALLKLQF